MSSHWYRRAQRLYRAHEQWASCVACSNGIGLNLGELFRLDSAAETLRHARQVGERYLGDDHPTMARNEYVLGLVELYRGDYEAARTHGQRALDLQRHHRGESRLPMADSYELLGIVDMRIGHYDRARIYHQRALTLRKAERKSVPALIANSYHHIGLAYQFQGAKDQALTYYQRALTMQKAAWGARHPSVAESYHDIGTVYSQRGEYDQALRYYQRALAIRKECFGDVHPSVALCYNSLGALYEEKKEYDQSLAYHHQALSIRQTSLGDTHPDVAISYNCAGNVYREQGNYQQALEYHRRALAIIKAQLGNRHPRTAMTLTRIGRVLHQQHAYAAALSAYREGLLANGATFADTSRYADPAIEQYADGHQLLFTLEAKAKTLSELGFHQRAYDTYLLTDTLLTQLNRSQTTHQDKISLAKTAKRLYERAIYTSWQRYHATQDEHYLRTAFYFSERSKAGVLNEALSTLEANTFGHVPECLLQREAMLKARRSFYRSQLTGPDSSTYQSKLFAVNRQYDSLVQVLELQHSDYYQLKYATRTATVPLVQSWLTSEEAMISYFMGDSTRCAFVITPTAFYGVALPSDTLLDTQLSALHQVLRSGNTAYADYQSPAYALYQHLLAPILEDASLSHVNDLTIVPDGALGFLPFELLLTTPPTAEASYVQLPYVLRNYTVHYGYSATWLLHPFGRSDRKATDQYIAFAPDYSDPGTSEVSARYHDQLGLLWYNRQEASNIRRYLSGVTYVGTEAVESRFKQEAHRYNVIHLAMHALVDEENPANSRLIFSRDATDSLEDGYLYAYELYDMELSADLAVLGACETGYGKLVQGEGIMSLARAFAYAGCPSIVMSHWLVDDAVSAQLMDEFYRRLAEGLPKDEALRQAKLAYLDNAPARKTHPFFWSNFVLIGDATPLAAVPKATAWWVYGIGGMLLVGLLVLAYVYRSQRRFRATQRPSGSPVARFLRS